MSDKMREEFEAAYISGAIRLAEDAGNVRYEDYHMQQAWVSWQASRAALVVNITVHEEFDKRMYASNVYKELDKAGISYE